MIGRMSDLVGTAGDVDLDAFLATINPVSAVAREASGTEPWREQHTHSEYLCLVCRECDHSQRLDCLDCCPADRVAQVTEWNRLLERVTSLFPHLDGAEAAFMAGNIANFAAEA